MKLLKWLYPGIKIKRYLLLIAIGVMLFSWGLLLIIKLQLLDTLKLTVSDIMYKSTGYLFTPTQTGIIIMVIGSILIILGVRQLINSVFTAIAPKDTDLVSTIYHKRQLERGVRIVAIGGGTGLSTLLRGIKKYSSNITACVTVADDGGSSGRLRSELRIPPPGDIRNCLVALADAEPLMSDLFQYRFSDGSLKGQNFGNLLIAAMTAIVGNFPDAVSESSRVLAVKGEVLPSTEELVTICAELQDGRIIEGESNIPKAKGVIKKVFLKPSNCYAAKEILERIEDADCIIIGPGSLYTSILPNLLLQGIVKKIEKSNALKIYVCNVMTQPGETDNYKASDHLEALLSHTSGRLVDYIFVNDREVKGELLTKYEKTGAQQVKVDLDNLKKFDIKIVKGDFISMENFVRHDSDKLAKAIFNLIAERR